MDNFKKGMLSTASKMPELDMKMLGIIAVVAVGIFLGLFMLYGGR